MGAMFIGQQFLQNVLGYTTFQSGAAILPGAICMVLVAPRSAKLVDKQGARLTMLTGYVFVLLGFLTMLLFWGEGTPYWVVALGYGFMGIGVGFAGTPASHSLPAPYPSPVWVWHPARQISNVISAARLCSPFSAHCLLPAMPRPPTRQSRDRA